MGRIGGLLFIFYGGAPSGPLTFNQEPKKFDLDGMMRGYPVMKVR